ncbi:MAG: HAD family hydrolase [Phycisphaerales bacterium]
MQRPGLILFDCDGVLVNTEPVVQQVLADWITQHGWPMTAEECARTVKGSHIAQIQTRLEQRTGGSYPDFIDGYRRAMFQAFESGVDEIPGAGVVLQTLRDAGMPFCIASNGPHVKMAVSMRSAGLLEHFGGTLDPSLVFSADDVGEPKPSPKLFLHAANTMGFDPGECLVIDDSHQGVEAALKAGMSIIAYEDMTPASKLHEAGAEIVMSRLEELLTLLGLESSNPA